MGHFKQQRWYQVLVYSFTVLCIGSLLLLSSIMILEATQTDIDCTEQPNPDCKLEKQQIPCPKSTVPPCRVR